MYTKTNTLKSGWVFLGDTRLAVFRDQVSADKSPYQIESRQWLGLVRQPYPAYHVYTADEVFALVGAADDYMTLVIGLRMNCALRKLEMVYLEWPDIHWPDKVLRVQGKQHWKFKVKDSEQRDVPIRRGSTGTGESLARSTNGPGWCLDK